MNIRRLSMWTGAIIFAGSACSSSDSALTDTQAPTSITTPVSQTLSAEMRLAVEEASSSSQPTGLRVSASSTAERISALRA